MSVFDLHAAVLDDYRDFVRSFFMVADERARDYVEIAIKGRAGLDPNDPAQQYELKSLPGKFSALHLLFPIYVAFKSFAPEMDIGFDLSQEYAAAQALHGEKQIH